MRNRRPTPDTNNISTGNLIEEDSESAQAQRASVRETALEGAGGKRQAGGS